MGQNLIFLLDTSVFSQPIRWQPLTPPLLRWRDAGDEHCAISRVCLAEIEAGLEMEGAKKRREKYQALLKNRLPVLPTDDAVWTAFAKMRAAQAKIGQPVTPLDLLIAATAKVHDLTVATLNARDFSRIQGIRWEDWNV